LERNPYSPPSALVVDNVGRMIRTPWRRAAAFYWAFLWRMSLILCGMSVPFLSLYWIPKLFLDGWPVFELLFRLTCIVAEIVFASCFAIQWAARASFRGYSLRILETTNAPASVKSTSPNGITIGRAAKLFGAHLWRYLLVVVPVNVGLIGLLVRIGVLQPQPGGWMAVLKMQAICQSFAFIAGIWAMREALSASFRGFQFRWIAQSSAQSNILEASPSPSRDH